MKAKFLIVLSCILFVDSIDVGAQQLTRKAKDSVVNAATKYLTWTSTPSKLKSIVLSFKKSTGTPAATVTLQYRVDTVAAVWQNADSTFATYTITGDSLTFIWKVPNQFFNGVRIKVVGSGTQKTYLWGAYMRRPDD